MNATVEQSSSAPLIHPEASIVDCTLGKWTDIAARTKLMECIIDDYSYVMNDCDLIYTRVGKFCSIASHVRVNPSNHPYWRASQHHFTYRASFYHMGKNDEQLFEWRRENAVTIGHDVWLGHGAVILPGNTVGTGAIVGAGAIVTKDIQPYSIVVGNPATHLRYRFSHSVQEKLFEIAWWDWDHLRLQAALRDFQQLSVEEFIEKHS
ncbi:LbetaH domain-containing protein [Halodesulfovibrio spirochaetisodalis]|uniref:Chloramphenicol acetyltransferase n=1 Tax=Halodesulfovibrio spirochaetisodalis TaxID=1560234 RepID=A0A1B7XDI4_9BACT|nr:chloramphenicol acetyltransferase [Halodesulfovibrio spirochaetisodalis]OBQ52127.1 hypothetical protein SP90_08075 [Halodesulfovibrio spirochaetisodalis]